MKAPSLISLALSCAILLHIPAIRADEFVSLGPILSKMTQHTCVTDCLQYTSRIYPGPSTSSDLGFGMKCGKPYAASCYCATAVASASVAAAFITACASSSCSAGDISYDISAIESIYASYCMAQGFTQPGATNWYNAAAATTTSKTQTSSTKTASSGATITQVTSASQISAESETTTSQETTAQTTPPLVFTLGFGYNTPTNVDAHVGLPQSQIIGLGVGAGIGVPALLLAFGISICCCVKKRRRARARLAMDGIEATSGTVPENAKPELGGRDIGQQAWSSELPSRQAWGTELPTQPAWSSELPSQPVAGYHNPVSGSYVYEMDTQRRRAQLP